MTIKILTWEFVDNKTSPVFLDEEEKDIVESYERGEWKAVDNEDEWKGVLKKSAANYLKKDSRVNIRIASSDLDRIKELAAYEGLPYQTLISSILHKFAAGYLHANNNHR